MGRERLEDWLEKMLLKGLLQAALEGGQAAIVPPEQVPPERRAPGEDASRIYFTLRRNPPLTAGEENDIVYSIKWP